MFLLNKPRKSRHLYYEDKKKVRNLFYRQLYYITVISLFFFFFFPNQCNMYLSTLLPRPQVPVLGVKIGIWEIPDTYILNNFSDRIFKKRSTVLDL